MPDDKPLEVKLLRALAAKDSDLDALAEQFPDVTPTKMRKAFAKSAATLAKLAERKAKKKAEKAQKEADAKEAAAGKSRNPEALDRAEQIKIYTDGACSGNPGPMGIGYVFESLTGETLLRVSRRVGDGTNNTAEYMALIAALEHALKLGKRRVFCFSDSQLMVNQVNGKFKVKTPTILPLIKRVIDLRRQFDAFQLVHIGREFNSKADGLASGALKR